MFSPRDRMKKIGSILLAGFLVLLCCGRLAAQSDDPSEVFLKAYMTSQQAEKLERESQFKAALAKYRFAGSLLEELRKRHADWQPAIVEYRGRKVGESILRVQGKASTQEDLTTGPTPLPGNAPVIPPNPGSTEPSVEIDNPRAGNASAPALSDAAIKGATKKLQDKVDQLQVDLQKSRGEFDAMQKEKDSLNGRLLETNTKLEQAQGDLEKSKGAEKQIRDQLADAQKSLEKIQSSGTGETKAGEALRSEIAQLKKTLVSAEKGRAAAEKAKDEATTKAGKQIAGAAKERDDAVLKLKGVKDAQQRVQTLTAENTNLKQKLADAEKTVRTISEDKPKKEKELTDVKQQIDQLRQQLTASQKQNKTFETTVADLRSQLDQASTELDKAKLTGANPEETARLAKENAMLRNIVVRERQEEARRDQAKKLMLAEFEKLQIKSDTLNEQIELLAQPIAKLSDEELALLRQPVISISDDNPAALKASFTFAKKAPTNPVKVAGPDGKAKLAPDTDESPPESSAPSNFKPSVPDELVETAWQAKENFDHGKYRSAERQYQDILTKSPNNLYSLSNLGVVYFRTGKLKAAELTLKKAVAIAPKDEFSHTTLGIVFYRQAKFDDALTELTKSLAIDPKSATAHNYLGITASQKGWQEAAEKEMLEAISDNPLYADAHFNLAVIYATATPPAKELAKRHYIKATELGAEHDASLEKLLR
jgi:Flp pilus assembly protein TadD/predicted  nucleic acid-binding Zn-ribbon protein